MTYDDNWDIHATKERLRARTKRDKEEEERESLPCVLFRSSSVFCLPFILLFSTFHLLLISLHQSLLISPLLPPLFLISSPWSICDPDVHHRRLTSCVWASSIPPLLLFIPHCVLVCVCVWERALWTAYKYTSMGTCTLCVLVDRLTCFRLFSCVCLHHPGHPAGGSSSIT